MLMKIIIHIILILLLITLVSSFLINNNHYNNNRRTLILSANDYVDASGFRIFSKEWAKLRGMEPGFGGIWPGNPDAPKFKVTIKSKKTGEEYVANVPADRYIYFYFEEMGIDLPIINKQRMCRQGCCTICTGKMEEGKVKMDAPLGLLKDMRNENVITCCAYPRSDIVITLQEEDEMYIRQWSEGFEGGGTEWGGFLPDDD